MKLTDPPLALMEEAFRWFGPNDPVPLSHIRQAGATAVFSSLHQIPYGDPWPLEAIRERRKIIEEAGLKWTAVESVPVHESIKTGVGNLEILFQNYATSIRNLATEGITTVIYNFMPVLDWVRTDTRNVLDDGSECLKFDPLSFAAFELFALRREGAEDHYDAETQRSAKNWWDQLSDSDRNAFIQTIIDVFPGVKLNLTLEDIRKMLEAYAQIGPDQLRKNLQRFLEAIVPVAIETGTRLAIHPDDPPFALLGLPRIVSTASDLEQILAMVDQSSNGLCFCTGSLGARPDNDLPQMVRRFGPRIHAVHLRSTQREPDGSFYEADHLAGSVNMPAVVQALLEEQTRRKSSSRPDWQLPFRPDHGHAMMDDLNKPPFPNPGYSGIGRMRGLAELRGLMHGLRYAAMSREGHN